ncbi:MAG: DinB family protein [Actinomycetota bacterium]|nr:DinB family protein [Actinomycetota bacterium]
MPGQAPPLTDERALLLAYIAQQRDGLRYAAYGLTDDQARLTPTAGTLSIGGLIKHVAATEQGWVDLIVQRRRPVSRDEGERAYHDGFRLLGDETLPGVLARYAEVAAETEAVVAGVVDLAQPVPVPKGVPWFPADVDAWSVRWVLLHVLEETARHAGHADIVRESIDGATMHPLMAAAEGWPATEWLTPWRPRDEPSR